MTEEVASRQRMGALVRETIAGILPTIPADEVPDDKHLKEIGADSVDRVEIILALIDRLGLDEPMASFSAIPTIGALGDFLWERSRR